MSDSFTNPFIKSVVVNKAFELLITFDNQEKKLFDVTPFLNGAAFAPLRDFNEFKKVQVLDGWGLLWSNGCDLSHDTAYLCSVSINQVTE